MLNKIKTYFKDYAACQKECNKFNKKHWLGNLIMCVLAWIITLATFGLAGWIKIKKEEKQEEYSEEE